MCFSSFNETDRLGSLADLLTNSSLMSGFGWKAVIREPIFKRPGLNVCFSRKRSFRSVKTEQFQGPLSAGSGHCSSQISSPRRIGPRSRNRSRRCQRHRPLIRWRPEDSGVGPRRRRDQSNDTTGPGTLIGFWV